MRLHHIGIVVPSIDQQLDYYRANFGMTLSLPKTFDPLQDVHVAFLQSIGTPVMLELIEPVGASSPVANALRRGGGLNHLCYAVPAIEKNISEMIDRGAMLVKPLTPATAFDGRRIAFLYTKNRELIELVEELK